MDCYESEADDFIRELGRPLLLRRFDLIIVSSGSGHVGGEVNALLWRINSLQQEAFCQRWILTIKYYRLNPGGIAVFQHGWAEDFSLAIFHKYVNLALKSGFGMGLYGFDPLVLDLDGDGHELTTEGNSQAYFEFDGDGFGERTGWVRPDDGLLALDLNGNGAIAGAGNDNGIWPERPFILEMAA